MIFGADTIFVSPRDSPADRRRSRVPELPKNLPTVRPIALVGMFAPVAVAARSTRKLDDVVESVLKAPPPRPRFRITGPCECSAPVPAKLVGDVLLIELMPHCTPRPRAKALLAWTMRASI